MSKHLASEIAGSIALLDGFPLVMQFFTTAQANFQLGFEIF